MGRRSVVLVVVGALVAAAPAHGAFPQDPPNDPLYDQSELPGATNEQWDLSTDRGISVDRAWALSTGVGVTIADLDVGVQLDHPDLAGQWAPGGWDFYAHDDNPTSDTRNEHGTNVAGVLAAKTDNATGIAGIAPDARVLPLRTADNILHQGARLAQAIVYAADHGASVISASLGADSFPRSLRQAIRYAYRRGVVTAVASGNEFHFHHHQPQVLPEVLAVGGVNPDTANIASKDQRLAVAASDFKVKAAYADYGPHLDVVAPVQVPTTTWGGYRMTWEGTSAAAPHVAGVVALVQARAKQLGLPISAGQVIQIVRGTADDLQKPGWDALTGYGRVNAARAVERVSAQSLPPVARIDEPFIYAPKTRPFRVWGRADAPWRLELGRGEEPANWRTIGTGRPGTRFARIDPRGLEPGGWTLRLTAGDSEDRSFFHAQREGRVRDLTTSGESSPQLADVNGDGRADIVLATSDGTMRVLSGRTLRPLKGWPRRTDRAPGSQPTERALRTPVRSGFLATPAIGDVAGDARPEIVGADLDGRIYAWSSRGRRLRGFPRHINLQEPGDDEKTSKLDAAIYASPALADLNADGKLDIVVGAADQHLYAVDGGGRDLPGWPVLMRDGDDHAKVLSSPAVGDLDGDGKPDVVEGTAEVYGSTPDTSGRVYAFDHTGKPKPGWPIKPKALAADAIPLAGEGTPMSPVLADVDGDGKDEVAIAGFTGTHELFNGDGTSRHQFDSGATLAFGANAAFGRQSPDGPLGLFGGVIDDRLVLAQLNPASSIPFDHLRAGWNAATGEPLPTYPKPIEGFQIAAGPVIADVSGDGNPEVLAGSSGNVLHATQADGSEAPGWPKNLGGWLIAAPAAGDPDGDGRTEVVAVTRDGFLHVLDTPGRADAFEWPMLRHDAQNTGRYRSGAP